MKTWRFGGGICVWIPGDEIHLFVDNEWNAEKELENQIRELQEKRREHGKKGKEAD